MGGLVAGVALVMTGTRAARHEIAGLLIGLPPTDWLVVGVTVVVLLLAAALASAVPAIREPRVDPLQSIRGM